VQYREYRIDVKLAANTEVKNGTSRIRRRRGGIAVTAWFSISLFAIPSLAVGRSEETTKTFREVLASVAIADIDQAKLQGAATAGAACILIDPCDEECFPEEEGTDESTAPYRAARKAACLFVKLDAAVTKSIKDRGKLKGKLAGGLTSNQTQERDVSKVEMEASLGAGNFPDEFNVEWSTSVRYDDGKTTEEVSKAVFQYEHYFNSYIEGFGFIERFQNSYLDIDQRWEAGFGADFEWRTGLLRRSQCLRGEVSAKDEKRAYRCGVLLNNGNKALEAYRAVIAAGLVTVKDDSWDMTLARTAIEQTLTPVLTSKKPREAVLDSIEKIIKSANGSRLLEAIFHDESRFQMSLSGALFRDTEQFTLETQLYEDATGTDIGDPIKASGTSEATRLSVRPAIRVRGKSGLRLDARMYFKRAISGGVRGRSDLRRDGEIVLGFDSEGTLFGAKPMIEIKYEVHLDSVPPVLADLDLDDPAPGFSFRDVTAPDKHEVMKLMVGLTWK